MICSNCGRLLNDGVKFCSGCGKAQVGEISKEVLNTEAQEPATAQNISVYPQGYKPKNWTTALLLCIFTSFGHRYYTGKIGTAIIMTLLFFPGMFLYGIPCIALLVWEIIDLVNICMGKFTDKNGYPLLK